MSNPLLTPSLWKDTGNVSPPSYWNGTLYAIQSALTQTLTYIGPVITAAFQAWFDSTNFGSFTTCNIAVDADGVTTNYPLTVGVQQLITVPACTTLVFTVTAA